VETESNHARFKPGKGAESEPAERGNQRRGESRARSKRSALSALTRQLTSQATERLSIMRMTHAFAHVRHSARVLGIASVTALLVGCAHSNGALPLPPTAPANSAMNSVVPVPAEHALAVQPHQLTELYAADGAPHGAWSKMAPWLTWATATVAQSVILHSLGVKTEFYTDPNRVAPGDPLYSDVESTFAHDCAGHRITFPLKPGRYLMDPHSTKLAELWKNWVDGVGGQFDAVYEDSADIVVGVTSALPCNFKQDDWTAATNAMDRALNRTIIYNGLGALADDEGHWSSSPSIGLNKTSVGGFMEGCYSSAGSDAKPHEKVWAAMENTELQMVAAQKLFSCRGLNLTPAAQAIPLRLYMDASILLTYDPATTIVSEKFPTPTGFDIDPEVEFVPLDPVVGEPTDISALLQPGGTYGRQYNSCYLLGVSVGRCAIVVNSNRAGSKTFPWPGTYSHTLTLRGGGVLDGGTVFVNGSPPPGSVAAETAVIAIQ